MSRDHFEELLVELPYIPDDVLESAFLKDLKRSLRDQVVRCKTVNMNDIVEVDRLIEVQEHDHASCQVGSFPRTTSAPVLNQATEIRTLVHCVEMTLCQHGSLVRLAEIIERSVVVLKIETLILVDFVESVGFMGIDSKIRGSSA